MSRKQEIRERRRKQKKQKQMIMLGLIIIGAGLITAALVYPTIQLNNQLEDLEFSSRYMADGNAMGDPDAPVTITEYSDYGCGHCGSFAFETEPLLEEAYIKTNKVYFVSRSVGTMLRNASSVLATEASYCAGEQNKYWEMHDLAFANQTIIQSQRLTEGLLEKWVEAAGVDMDAYEACMKDNRYLDRIAQDKADAEAEGISGTPSFVISYVVDGEEVKHLLQGNYPLVNFEQIIAQAYQEMGLE